MTSACREIEQRSSCGFAVVLEWVDGSGVTVNATATAQTGCVIRVPEMLPDNESWNRMAAEHQQQILEISRNIGEQVATHPTPGTLRALEQQEQFQPEPPADAAWAEWQRRKRRERAKQPIFGPA